MKKEKNKKDYKKRNKEMKRTKKAILIVIGLLTIAIITGTATKPDKTATISSEELKGDASDLQYVPGLFGAISPYGRTTAGDSTYTEGMFGSIKRSEK